MRRPSLLVTENRPSVTRMPKRPTSLRVACPLIALWPIRNIPQLVKVKASEEPLPMKTTKTARPGPATSLSLGPLRPPFGKRPTSISFALKSTFRPRVGQLLGM